MDEKKLKFLKVIASSFHPRSIRMETTLNGNPVGYFSHSQNFTSETDIINLLKFNLDMEKKINPGLKQDIVIVSSNEGNFNDGKNFLRMLNNTNYEHGKIFTIIRENIGYSFGAYNHAYELFRHKYDYFTFTEDDMIVIKDNSILLALRYLQDTKNAGFVPFVDKTKLSKEFREVLLLETDDYWSCHGGIGMANKVVLEDIYKINGCLPHCRDKDASYQNQIIHGEIKFTSMMKRMGYEFADVPKNILFAGPAFDVMRGLKIKKYPNILQKVIYFFYLKGLKTIIYKVAVYLGLKKVNHR